jgi:hypothetical protein
MTITNEISPYTSKFTRFQWFAAGTVLGFFLGFVDTLVIAAILGHLGLKVPAEVGLPTTFSGYFFTGVALAGFAPEEITWEPPAGILVCVLIMMWGFAGLSGHGFFAFVLDFVVIPAIAMGVCCGGMYVARSHAKKRLESAK